jgi:transposase
VETKYELGSKAKSKVDPKVLSNESRYTKEFKEQLIEIHNSGIYSTAAECARNYDVPERLLYQWLDANKKQSNSSEHILELAKLKKENAQLKMELEILKKATVYFAKQMK